MSDDPRLTPPLAHTLSHDDGCMSLLEVSDGGRRVRYIGMGRDDMEAGSIRSNAPLAPSSLPIGYFEAEVADKGRDGYISVGLMNRRAALDKLVGWGEGAIGYHGDDGNLFVGSGIGRPFGPLYATGDTIGCGIDWISEQVFFTKNGRLIGAAKCPFEQSEEVYAGVGLRTPGETMVLHFGPKFTFGIESYKRELRKSSFEKLRSPEDKERPFQSILDYCLYSGHSETLKCLLEFVSDQTKSRYLELDSQRQRQLHFLLRIEQGICPLEELFIDAYPNARDPVISFHIRTLEFLEYYFENPADTAKILEMVHKLKELAQGNESAGTVFKTFVLRVLPYGNPNGSESATEARNTLRMITREQIERHANCQNTLSQTIHSINARFLEKRTQSTKMMRFWTFMDHADLILSPVPYF